MQEILKIIAFSAAAVVYLFLLSKLLGKKQIAELNFIDYAISISVGSIAAEMATDLTELPVYHYLIAMTVFFLFHLLIDLLERKGPKLKNFFKGRPVTVIYDGKIDYAELKKAHLDVNDLLSFARGKGYFDLDDIAFAVFETNGQLSILPKGNQRPAVAGDLNVKQKKAKLPCILVVDGGISFSGLTHINKDRDWLFKKLKLSSENELKSVLLAQYDTESDTMSVHQKNEISFMDAAKKNKP